MRILLIEIEIRIFIPGVVLVYRSSLGFNSSRNANPDKIYLFEAGLYEVSLQPRQISNRVIVKITLFAINDLMNMIYIQL